MSNLSKVNVKGTVYDLKDAQARTDIATAQGAIAAEVTRATGAESGLSVRIEALESRGRFLSSWNAGTGLPATYPEIPEGAAYPYTYEYKSGDYYIVDTVPTSGTKYKPTGDSITKASSSAAWVVGKAAATEELGVGDYFTYDGTKWIWVQNSTKTVNFSSIAGDPYDNTALENALQAKQDADDLGALAFKDKATGSYTPAGTIGQIDATPAGSVTLNAFTQTSTVANISGKADYTPAGTVSGKVVPTGTVTLNAFTQTPTNITSTGTYTPEGTIAAADGGTFNALNSATFAETTDGATGSVQIKGSISKPNVTVTAGAEVTVATGLKGGSVAAFDVSKFNGGSAASLGTGFVTAGSDASLTGGSVANLTAQSKSKFAKKAFSFTINSDNEEQLDILEVATSDTNYYTDAVTDRGTFTANTLQSLNGGKATVVDVSKFNGGSAASMANDIFTANTLQEVNTATVHDTPSAALASTPVFTGKSYIINTTADTALKEVEFTGAEGNLSVSGQYNKATAAGATFVGNAAGDAITASFSGTKAAQLIPTEIKYDKATANGASFTGTENKITPAFTGTGATIQVQ